MNVYSFVYEVNDETYYELVVADNALLAMDEFWVDGFEGKIISIVLVGAVSEMEKTR